MHILLAVDMAGVAWQGLVCVRWAVLHFALFGYCHHDYRGNSILLKFVYDDVTLI